MKHPFLFFKITFLILLSLLYCSCIEPDYFSKYIDKNLISHLDFTDWVTDQDATYTNWEEVSAAAAGGTTGLPDSSALIYRLEINNLVPDGDFDTSADPAAAGWTDAGTGNLNLEKPNATFGSNALTFDHIESGFSAEYLLSQLSDGAVNNSSYLFRFDLTSSETSALSFKVNSTSTITYKPETKIKDSIYNFPDDLRSTEVPSSEFTIYDNTVDSFSIDYNANPTGSIDNFRIVKTDQDHYARLSVPDIDTDRVDGLELIDGTYRFSIYVKTDPQAGTSNHYEADSVTLMIESFDSASLTSETYYNYFDSDDYIDFSEWREITIDLDTQITESEDELFTAIQLSVCPGNATSTSTLDACSVLISNPGLYYSEDGTF